jgi:hypothetical protein
VPARRPRRFRPGASFAANGTAHAQDSALATAFAEFKWINGWSAAATFEGEFSGVTDSHAGKGVVRLVSGAPAVNALNGLWALHQATAARSSTRDKNRLRIGDVLAL